MGGIDGMDVSLEHAEKKTLLGQNVSLKHEQKGALQGTSKPNEGLNSLTPEEIEDGWETNEDIHRNAYEKILAKEVPNVYTKPASHSNKRDFENVSIRAFKSGME